VETLNAYVLTTFTNDQPVQHLKQPQLFSGVVHVVQLFSPLNLSSARTCIADSNKVCVFAVNNKVCVVNNVQIIN
jgi:hypothetical protein